MSRDWLLYLGDLIEGAEKIERFVRGRTFETFLLVELAFDAVLFNLHVIGEATKMLPADVLAELPRSDRSGPARLRDLIAHHYFALDPEIIWEVVTKHVPAMLAKARELEVKAQNETRGAGEAQ